MHKRISRGSVLDPYMRGIGQLALILGQEELVMAVALTCGQEELAVAVALTPKQEEFK